MPDQPDITIGVQRATAAATLHGQRYTCPISTCSWTYDPPPPPAVAATLAHIFGPGVMTARAVSNYHSQIEAVLADHFGRHSIAEYVTEINSLQGLSLGLIKQVQELSEALADALRRSPDLRREVDPAAQLTAAVRPTPAVITGI